MVESLDEQHPQPNNSVAIDAIKHIKPRADHKTHTVLKISESNPIESVPLSKSPSLGSLEEETKDAKGFYGRGPGFKVNYAISL